VDNLFYIKYPNLSSYNLQNINVKLYMLFTTYKTDFEHLKFH